MNLDKAKEIHDLLFASMGLFYEKFFCRFRHEIICEPHLKKNDIKILTILYQHAPMILTEIGKRLDIEKGSLTTLIDSLEEKNLVVRSNDPADRRKTLISLSTKGMEEMDRVMDFYAKRIDDSLSMVDPGEIKEFQINLQKVVEFLKKV